MVGGSVSWSFCGAAGPGQPCLLRQMLTTFINILMFAAADAVCGAGYGQCNEDRTKVRNGYRSREFDTRAGTLEVDSLLLRTPTLPGSSPPSRWTYRCSAGNGADDNARQLRASASRCRRCRVGP